MDYRESWQLTPVSYRTHVQDSRGYLFKALSFVQANVAGLVLAAMLLLSFIGLHPLALTGGLDVAAQALQGGDGDSAKQAIFVFLFLLMVADTVATKGVRKLVDVPVPFIILLAWCWISMLWAIEPGIAVRRATLTTLVILTVSYCTGRLGYTRSLNAVVATFAIILVADWLSIGLFKFAIHQASEWEPNLAGDWRGMHSHKNEAGPFCALCVILFVNLSYRVRSFFIGPALVAASLVFLYMSQSKTSGGFVFVGMMGGACSVVSYRNPTLRNWVLMLILIAIGAVVSLIEIPFDAIATVFDDPGSFTGRSQIWPIMIAYAQNHLLLGSGYGSFWAIGDDSPILAYGTGWVQHIFEAHNAYLDILVQTGLIGLILAVACLVIRPLYQLFFLPLRQPASRWLICSIITFGCFHDLLETSMLDRANSTWVVLVIAYCLLSESSLSGRHPVSRVSAAHFGPLRD